MEYNEVLHWLYNRLPMYQTHGKSALVYKLDAVTNLCSYLANPQAKFKSIHVAGTNGKGSSSHMIASVLQEAGYKVGLYTSPHLKDFRERIKINGNSVSEDFVVDFVEQHKTYLEGHQLSFFEMTVGMAFDAFAKEQVDFAVVEVGLGGRLDSTNIITPEVSLITNIGMDHMDMLGDTLEKIAAEKAGIIKPGTPVVVSEFQNETVEVFKAKAASVDAEIQFASELVFDEVYESDLKGEYQSRNIKGVLAVLKVLSRKYDISDAAIKEGLLNVVKNTGLMGRWQQLGESPKVICDTAHNVDGLKLVMQQLLKESYGQLHMVIGFVNDKDLIKILPLLPKEAVYYFTQPDNKRALNSEELKNFAKKYELIGGSYKTVKSAYNAAVKAATSSDFIYVGGSTFVVAEIV